jgi:hypothetical protein
MIHVGSGVYAGGTIESISGDTWYFDEITAEEALAGFTVSGP